MCLVTTMDNIFDRFVLALGTTSIPYYKLKDFANVLFKHTSCKYDMWDKLCYHRFNFDAVTIDIISTIYEHYAVHDISTQYMLTNKLYEACKHIDHISGIKVIDNYRQYGGDFLNHGICGERKILYVKLLDSVFRTGRKSTIEDPQVFKSLQESIVADIINVKERTRAKTREMQVDIIRNFGTRVLLAHNKHYVDNMIKTNAMLLSASDNPWIPLNNVEFDISVWDKILSNTIRFIFQYADEMLSTRQECREYITSIYDNCVSVLAPETLRLECCCICLLENEDQAYGLLPCKHGIEFHHDCILNWLEEYNNICPLCRQVVDVRNKHEGNKLEQRRVRVSGAYGHRHHPYHP